MSILKALELCNHTVIEPRFADRLHTTSNSAHAYIVSAYMLQRALHTRFPAFIPFYKISTERPRPFMADSCIYDRSLY